MAYLMITSSPSLPPLTGLPTNKLSQFLEDRVNNFLQSMESGSEVTIRVVSSFDKVLETRPLMKDRFQVSSSHLHMHMHAVRHVHGASSQMYSICYPLSLSPLFPSLPPSPPALRVTSRSSSLTRPRPCLCLKRSTEARCASSASTSRSMAQTAWDRTLGGCTSRTWTAFTSSTLATCAHSCTTRS